MPADPVLVVGAGPTGMLAALLLGRRGVPVRIVDAAPGPVETSRAMGVQARTLEFYRMIGLAEEAVSLGTPTREVRIRRNGRPSGSFSLAEMGAGLSPYPYLLTLAQDVHERMLIGALEGIGVSVERRTELLALAQDAMGVTATLRGPDGAEVTARAPYVIGADGAGSAARKALGVGFGGGTSSGLFYVADATLEAEPAGDLTVGLGPDTLSLMMPVRTSGTKRLIGIVPPELADRHGLTFEDLGSRAEGLLGVRTREVNWFSTYRVHHRVADRFRVGRVFLAGDACHIHSPVGGQGMNTGLGDAVNLAWKLADVLEGRAHEALLETYHAERHAFAKALIETTDAAFQKIVARSALGRFLRVQVAPRVAPALAGMGLTRRALFRTVSQTRIAYPRSALSEGRAGSMRGGDRLPWVEGVDTHAPLDGRTWQLHVHGTADAGLLAEARRLGLAVHVFDWSPEMHAAGLARDAAHLVRPDGHVALAGATAISLRAFVDRHGLRFGPATLRDAA
ncbi:FAD-dependent monooxygenase [Jannaschia sp. Os4]|uniref:FAD-dependent monooxygenase n=1 Tax=Jannaschia sp. Os4 TaxID=2807617 RepID=UPI00193A63E8|nr:FAD-dependent monooxygenase [Jannaschia sp. Os4]MBM2576307.1 FAD-dependent monooxygenase [Jannaschia sp. Os4]